MAAAKTVFITGANHGLGLSLTKIFLQQGHKVAAGVYPGCDSSQIRELPATSAFRTLDLDVSSDSSVRNAAINLRQWTTHIDILINNAAILPLSEQNAMNTISDPLNFDEILQAINVNALGAVRTANTLMPLLYKGTDKLICNISSEAGSIAVCERTGWFGYCMSKAALNMAGALMHNGFREQGGRVLQIQPGYMQTYMHGRRNDQADHSPDFSAEHIYRLLQNPPESNPSKAQFLDLFGNPLEW